MYLNVNRYEAVESGSINDVIRYIYESTERSMFVDDWLVVRRIII